MKKYSFNFYRIFVIFFLLNIFQVSITWATPPKSQEIKLLIVDGFSNHDWQRTTKLIKQILQQYGGIDITVSTSPNSLATEKALKNWDPDFSSYDVVLLNCNDLGHPVQWSHKTKRNLETFVFNGGGLYILHSANNAFAEWDEYNRMIGLGWRKKILEKQ